VGSRSRVGVWCGKRKGAQASIPKQRQNIHGGGGDHSLRDLSVEAFQLGMKAGHQLKHFLLGKSRCVGWGEGVGRRHGLQRREGELGGSALT
jgi:hypothetical protein